MAGLELTFPEFLSAGHLLWKHNLISTRTSQASPLQASGVLAYHSARTYGDYPLSRRC